MDDLERLAADLTEAAGSALGFAEVVVRKSTADVERDAKILAPVDTGFLRSSISSDVQSDHDSVQGSIGPTADYGEYVETGTSRNAPQPYMGPAHERNVAGFEAGLAQIADHLL